MVVELSPVEDLDLDREMIEFVTHCYCGNCRHIAPSDAETNAPYCRKWDEETRLEGGYVCPAYQPQGYPD